ncbi:MAG: DUF362 domain-containing protein [Clostridiales bacterium]|nr:DUF362 domain-containing protein [Clostridiales bacterium]
MAEKLITRRDFLRVAAVTPFVGAMTTSLKGEARPVSSSKARVVLVRDKEALDSAGRHTPHVIQKMLDDAVMALFDVKSPVDAWRRIVQPTDTVGIKSNVWHYIPTGEAVEKALKRRILDVGVPEEKIGIDDRGVLRNPIFKNATVLINARPARTHHWSGMGGCIKNVIMFVPNPAAYHGDSCADLAKIWSLPLIKDKVKLNILLLLTPLFHGIGPHHYSEQYVWPYSGILLSQDPVAVDATGMRILQAKRRQHFREERPLQPSAHHIVLADTRHHLGVSDPNRIDLIKLGWQEDILI